LEMLCCLHREVLCLDQREMTIVDTRAADQPARGGVRVVFQITQQRLAGEGRQPPVSNVSDEEILARGGLDVARAVCFCDACDFKQLVCRDPTDGHHDSYVVQPGLLLLADAKVVDVLDSSGVPACGLKWTANSPFQFAPESRRPPRLNEKRQ